MCSRLRALAYLFLKFGLTAFGGPAAHVAMLEDEIVRKRKWMDEQHFLDLVGATNLIPGPNSTEIAIHCGYEHAGVPGMITAGLGFILPAVIMSGILAHVYVAYGTLPNVEPFLFGIKPAVLAIIVNAVYRLGGRAVKNWKLAVLGVSAVTASLLGADPVTVIIGTGFVGMLWFSAPKRLRGRSFLLIPPLGVMASAASVPIAVSGTRLFLVFLKVGALLFGSGYVLVAYLNRELVENLGWLTKAELLDAIAIGQFTPGPILSTSTFVGYRIAGVPGAVLATVGIFLPSFLFVLAFNRFIPKMRKSTLLAGFLDAVNVAAVGVMTAVAVTLGRNVLTEWRAWAIAVLAAAVVIGFRRIGSFWIVLGGAAAGYLLRLIG